MDKEKRGENSKRPIENWLANKLEEMKKPSKVPDAVCEMAIMYRDNLNSRGREVRDPVKNSFNWDFIKDADLVALSYYHANLQVSMRSIEVRK